MLTFRGPAPSHKGHKMVMMLCDCGKLCALRAEAVRRGQQSCGCLLGKAQLTHGRSRRCKDNGVFRSWEKMRERCHNENHVAYPSYGGRGITVCERWRESFENFLADMGEKPSPRHSIDRFPNKDGNYEPGNCRWATAKEQNNNTRSNRLLTFQGRTQTAAQWAEEIGIPYGTFMARLRRWSVERAITEPIKESYARSDG